MLKRIKSMYVARRPSIYGVEDGSIRPIKIKGETKQASTEQRWFGKCLPLNPKELPRFVLDSISHLEKNGIFVEGLFKTQSNKEFDTKAKEEIEKSNIGYVNFSKFPIHTACTMLKKYLRELPQPLLTYECYSAFTTASKIPELSQRAAAIKQTIALLPTSNALILKHLLKLLSAISGNQETTKMSVNTIAIMFSDNLLLTNEAQTFQESMKESQNATMLVKTMIEENSTIFPDDDDEDDNEEKRLFAENNGRRASFFSKLIKKRW